MYKWSNGGHGRILGLVASGTLEWQTLARTFPTTARKSPHAIQISSAWSVCRGRGHAGSRTRGQADDPMQMSPRSQSKERACPPYREELQGRTHTLPLLTLSSFIPKVGKVPPGTRAGSFLSEKHTGNRNAGKRPVLEHPGRETEARVTCLRSHGVVVNKILIFVLGVFSLFFWRPVCSLS